MASHSLTPNPGDRLSALLREWKDVDPFEQLSPLADAVAGLLIPPTPHEGASTDDSIVQTFLSHADRVVRPL